MSLRIVFCSPIEGEQLIDWVRQDLPQKTIAVLKFDQSIKDGDFYQQTEEFLYDRDGINILFAQELEHSLLDYEETKKRLGWSDEEIYSHTWKGVPRVLMNLKQQRERFRDNFNICLSSWFHYLFSST